MADRRWTVMVVPHGSDSPRSFSISERAVRAGVYVGSVLALMALVGLGSTIATTGRLISSAVRPTEANAMSSRPRDVAEVARRVASLRDTLDVIRKREAQIRLLAGLPATDSGGPNAPAAVPVPYPPPIPYSLLYGTRVVCTELSAKTTVRPM